MPRPYNVRRMDQLESLALPIRTEIVESVSFLGPSSVAEMARVTGQKRPAVHFHVRKLMEVGLLLEAGARGEGRRRQTLYKTPGTPVYAVYDRNDPANVELIAQYARNILSRAGRLLAAAFARGTRTPGGPRRETYATQRTSWLDAEGLAEVNALIEEIEGRMLPSSETSDRRLFSLTLTLSPVPTEEKP